MMTANNITRLLDNRKINYRAFELPRQKLDAEQTARLLNAPLSIIFKSIVIERVNPGKPILAVVPGDKEVNLKTLAKVVGEKKGAKSAWERAQDRVEELLSKYQPSPISDEIKEELREITTKAANQVGMKELPDLSFD